MALPDNFSDEAPEVLATEIKTRHGLTGLHVFDRPEGWRVFGFRKHAQGYNESVENGNGPNIVAALNDLDARLTEGPIHAVKPQREGE
jgi:hypothetical protein